MFGLVGPTYQYFGSDRSTPISPAGSGVINGHVSTVVPNAILSNSASTYVSEGQVAAISYTNQK
jgi:hypothetical protein